MKKIILFMIPLLSIYLINIKEYNISEDTIRYRVIANSNSLEDLLMKEKIVDELSGILFKENQSIEQVNDTIYKNLNNIEQRIKKVFINNNYNKKFNISYGLNKFPEKTFLGKKYKAGEYKSLVIEIGEAKGNNYFCILYPSLCIVDYHKNNKNNKYDLKIREIINNLF